MTRVRIGGRLTITSPAQVICPMCGTVLLLPPEVLCALAASLTRHTRFVLDADTVALTGTCPACAAR